MKIAALGRMRIEKNKVLITSASNAGVNALLAAQSKSIATESRFHRRAEDSRQHSSAGTYRPNAKKSSPPTTPAANSGNRMSGKALPPVPFGALLLPCGWLSPSVGNVQRCVARLTLPKPISLVRTAGGLAYVTA
jgi:hypothetical protein